jgi:hypothetical protein
MSLKTFTTSAAVIGSLLAANLAPLAATAASARDGWRGNGGPGYARAYDGPRYNYGPRHDYGPRYHHGYRKHRHNHGRDVATGIAIGLGVLAVGSIIASHR